MKWRKKILLALAKMIAGRRYAVVVFDRKSRKEAPPQSTLPLEPEDRAPTA